MKTWPRVYGRTLTVTGDLIRKRENKRREQDTPLSSEQHENGEALDMTHEHYELARRAPITNTPKESILGQAHRLVQGKRGAEYGHPLDNHTTTAQMFSAYLQRKYGLVVPLDADDVCWFNIFQKGSRDANEPREDNLVDTAGYAFNLELIRAERERRDG